MISDQEMDEAQVFLLKIRDLAIDCILTEDSKMLPPGESLNLFKDLCLKIQVSIPNDKIAAIVLGSFIFWDMERHGFIEVLDPGFLN